MINDMQLFEGDCLEVMKSIPNGSIDAIITDPPYGTTACKWDSVIPFDLMWEQLNRIIKPNGAIVLFGSEPFSSALRMSNIKNYKYDWVWDKVRPFGFLDSKLRPMKKHENIIIFSFGGCSNRSKIQMKYNPQGLIYKPRRYNYKSKSNILNSELKQCSVLSNYTNYPNSIIEFNPDKNAGHPTQKPVALMEYLIKTYTNESETVLDFTMGSGSAGVACVNTNRKFIGIEKDEKYFTIAKQRIESQIHKNNFKLL